MTREFDLPNGGSFVALEAVSFTLGRGDVVSLTGKSGCGKSTLLRMVASLDLPSSGLVTVDGRQPRELALEHKIGVAFQDSALLPWLSVKQNVELPFHLARTPVDRTRVAELISLVGLEKFTDAAPRQLSGGMRQRVSIARALAMKPEVLLLDEPFAALDAMTRRQMNLELQKILIATKTTTLLVTHSPEEAVFLSDRVIALGSSPGQVRRVIQVPNPRPRETSFLTSPELLALAERVSEALN